MADLSNVVRMLIHQLDATRSYLLPGYCDEDEKARAVIAFAESALAAEPPESAEPVATLHVSNFRGYENYDFQHLVDLPPGHYKLFTACTAQPPAPAPADHVPDAGDMVAADGEWEEVAAWLDEEAKRCAVQFYDRITSAAALLLRQLPPKGMEAIRYCVEEDGAVIQRTSRAPESWAIRAGSACMSTTGEWDIEPMPSDRTDEWLANHRWPSAAAAWEALQQARGQEVGDE